MKNKIIPVILSGGSGTRLWPLSRKHDPKQFLPLVTNKTMFQETLIRLSDFPNIDAPQVVCNEDHRFFVAEQLQQLNISEATILLEPVAKNTGPAVAVAALKALSDHDDPLLLVLPADHVIHNKDAFHAAIDAGCTAANAGKLVTFGIVPSSAETGYGYIKAESVSASEAIFPVDQFVEKPDLETAKRYLESGNYFWNSGMFLFKAKAFLDELNAFQPAMFEACKKSVVNAVCDYDFFRLNKDAFNSSPSDSIDYAVMEKTDKAVVVPLDAGWNDVGAWSSLWEITDKDDDGNVVKGDAITIDTSNSYIYSSDRMIATVGVKDHVVIETADAVMVAHIDHVQDVKKVVEQLKKGDCKRSLTHRKVSRPWGNYDSVDAGHRFQVKRIVVNPGASLSLQMHYHRAEHWIVVKGTAKVTKGNEIILLSENQSTYIPLGTKHRLENPGTIPLEIVEVQSGSYLGEDDIVRFDDVYGRSADNNKAG